MRGAGLIGRHLQTGGLVAVAPRGDGLPRDALPFGDLINGCPVVDFGDSTQTDLDRDTCRRIRLRNLRIDHHETVTVKGCPSTYPDEERSKISKPLHVAGDLLNLLVDWPHPTHEHNASVRSGARRAAGE